MKKRYSILLSIIAIDFFVLSILSKNNIGAQTWIGNAISAFVSLLPIQTLLFLLSKDSSISAKKRILCKTVFWFISVCYVLGGIATLV